MAKVVDNLTHQRAALDLMNNLHREGFNRLWLDSLNIHAGGRMKGGTSEETVKLYLNVVIDEEEVSGERFDLLDEIACAHDASIVLRSFVMHQQHFSRLALWVRGDD